MRRRVIALVAALALAGVGTVVLVSFVRSAEERAGAGEAEVAIWRVNPLAQAPIAAGTKVGEALDAGLLEQAQVDQDSVPVGVVPGVEERREQLFLVDLQPGEAILDSKLGDVVVDASRGGEIELPPVEIPDGYVQVPVKFEPEQALGGLVKAGNEVAIIAIFDDYTIDGGSSSVSVDGEEVVLPDAADGEENIVTRPVARTLLDRVLVSAVQSDAPPVFQEEGSDVLLTPATAILITFAVPPEDAERLVFAASQGRLWLAYTDESVEAPPREIVNLENIFDAEEG